MKTFAYKTIMVGIFVSFTYIMEAQTIFTVDSVHLEPWDSTLVIMPPPPPPSGTCTNCAKEIYLIHGLGGDGNSWMNVDQAILLGSSGFPARDVLRVKKLDYSHPQYAYSLYLMAEKINSDIKQEQLSGTAGPQNTILLAHSQGGLVTRELNYRNMSQTGSLDIQTQRTGPVITFGTPHQGAQILNNIDPNGPKMTHAFINQACSKLGLSEASNVLKNYWLLSMLTQNYLTEITNRSCNSLTTTSINLMFKDMMIPATTEYRVGAQKINELNTVSRTVPYLLFHGIEEAPVFWRTMYSYTYQYPLATLVDPFGMTDDSEGVVKFNNLRNNYLAREIDARNKANEQGRLVQRLSNPFLVLATSGGSLIAAGIHRQYQRNFENISKIHKEAKEFVENANERWERIIGARATNGHRTLVGYQCRCFDEERPLLGVNISLVLTPQQCVPSNASTTCTTIPVYTLSNTLKPNDGVVLSESAAFLSGALVAPPMFRTNHQQMRNCTATKLGLVEAFDGGFGIPFKLKRK